MTNEELGNKAASLQELADHFGVSKKIIRKWHKMIEPELGRKNGHLYPPRQVKIFLKHFGMLVLAWFAKAGDAIASPFRKLSVKMSSAYDAAPGNGPLAHSAMDLSLYFLHPGMLLSATAGMFYGIKILAQTFIKNPYSTISGNKTLRAISIIMIIIASGVIGAAGYVYGKMLLA